MTSCGAQVSRANRVGAAVRAAQSETVGFRVTIISRPNSARRLVPPRDTTGLPTAPQRVSLFDHEDEVVITLL